MSRKNIRRTILLVAAVMMLLSVSAYARNGTVACWGTAKSLYNYSFNALPTAEKLEKELGYLPAITAEFENGYALRSGSINYGAFFDEDYNEMERYKEMMVNYFKGGDRLIYAVKKFDTPVDVGGTPVAEAGGVQIRYNAYNNKLVPVGYELTDEDRAAQASGELVFSYGVDSIETVRVQSVGWEKDGILYGLLQIDGQLTQAELVNMAKELIAQR